jgi:hypothetical protein
MATGEFGTTIQAELNRLANGGTYPTRDQFLDIVGAANAWAGTDGKGLLASLNYIADSDRPADEYRGFQAVCNEIADTIGLSAVEALRSIDNEE